MNIKAIVNTFSEHVGSFSSPDKEKFKIPEAFIPYMRPNVTLNKHEVEVAMDVILPEHIDTDYGMIGGAEDEKLALWECIYDIVSHSKNVAMNRTLHSFTPVRGVLLFGPPG